jgi:hypothetical protein
MMFLPLRAICSMLVDYFFHSLAMSGLGTAARAGNVFARVSLRCICAQTGAGLISEFHKPLDGPHTFALRCGAPSRTVI